MDMLHDRPASLESLWIAIASAEFDAHRMGIAVWRCALPHLSGAQLDEAVDAGWLTGEERAAARRRIGAVVQSRFGSRRILRRLIVARVLEALPSAVRFAPRCLRCGSIGHGAPRVVRPAGTRLHMSTSSVGDRMVVALGRHPVGVDIESADRVGDVSASRMAGVLPGWQRVIDACGSTAPAGAAWTALEALGKATGRGVLASAHDIDRAVRTHRLAWITDDPGLVVCVASAAPASTITVVDLTEGRAVG